PRGKLRSGLSVRSTCTPTRHGPWPRAVPDADWTRRSRIWTDYCTARPSPVRPASDRGDRRSAGCTLLHRSRSAQAQVPVGKPRLMPRQDLGCPADVYLSILTSSTSKISSEFGGIG